MLAPALAVVSGGLGRAIWALSANLSWWLRPEILAGKGAGLSGRVDNSVTGAQQARSGPAAWARDSARALVLEDRRTGSSSRTRKRQRWSARPRKSGD